MSRLLQDWQSEAHVTLAPADPMLWARFMAWLRSGHCDRQLSVGTTPEAGTPLAVHAGRLTSTREREDVARALRRCIRDAYCEPPFRTSRIQVDASAVVGAEEIIDSITLRLHSPRPVTARGMAQLRLLLADGGGPLYRYGRGDLEGRLRAAFSSL